MVFLAILAIEIVILVPSHGNERRRYLEALEGEAVTVVRLLLPGEAGADNSASAIRARIAAGLNQSMLRGAFIHRADGTPVGEVGEPPLLSYVPGAARAEAVLRDGDRYEVVLTPDRLGKPFAVVARIDASRVREQLDAFVYRIGGLVLLIALFVTVVTMAALTRTLLAPLLLLRRQMMGAATDPDRLQRYLVNAETRGDELGDVIRAFNELIARNATYLTDLQVKQKDIAAAKEEAERASRAKSEFLASMSHELRTPLNAILGFSEVMRDQVLGPMDNEIYRGYCADIHMSGSHLLTLINDILDLSKAEAGRLMLDEEEDIDLCEELRAAARMVHGRAERGGVSLIEELGEQPLRICADPRKLRQIALNLLSNAIKFTPRGGKVVLRLIDHPGEPVILQVADSGIGIAPEDLQRVMEPFGQARTSVHKSDPGTGLGLPLAKAMVELHGGGLTLASRPNEGTLVTVTFPADRRVG